MNDVSESFGMRNEECQNIELIIIDGLFHRFGRDEIAHVQMGFQPG
jgi:hypothetical protein